MSTVNEENFMEDTEQLFTLGSVQLNNRSARWNEMTVENPLKLDYVIPSLAFKLPNMNLDLETFVESYTGYDKIERLLFVAAHFPSLEVESLRLAALELKSNTLDINRYEKTLSALQEAESRHHIYPHSTVDVEFIESATKKAQSMTKNFEEGYREAREGGISESIRQALLELADHCVYCGDFEKALDYYLKTRDFAGKPSHKFLMCLYVAQIYWRLKKLDKAETYIIKASKLESHVRDEKHLLLKFHILRGLLHVYAGEWKNVSEHIRNSQALGLPFTSYGFSLSDMSIYANLCSVASLSRDELIEFGREDLSSVKDMLHYSPEAREATKAFILMQPLKFLNLLEDLRSYLLLDPYIHAKLDELLSTLRKRCIISHLSSFECVPILTCARLFGVSSETMEKEISVLIETKELDMRIDGYRKILITQRRSERDLTYQRILAILKRYSLHSKIIMMRSQMVMKDLILRTEE